MDPLRSAWLGVVEYRAASALQERVRAAILDGSGPESLLALEHPPVITLGRSADPENVLFDESALAERGVALVQSDRGGDVTYHGPGQLVVYPVVRAPSGAAAFVGALAAAVVDVVKLLNITAEYRCDEPGVWVGDRKLCAFGVHLHKRVATHGLALNVSTALDAFSLIVPCGLKGRGVTSLAELLGGRHPSSEELAQELLPAVARRLDRALEPLGADEIRRLISSPPLVECDA